MKTALQRLMTGMMNAIITFLLMAAPIGAIIYSSYFVDSVKLPDVRSAIDMPYREFMDEYSQFRLNQWYADLTDRAAIDIVYRKLVQNP